MSFLYSAFGLRLRANAPLPGLLRSPETAGHDVLVSMNELPVWLREAADRRKICHRSPYLNQSGEPSMRIWTVRDGAYYWFVYDDGAEFLIDRAGTAIWAAWPPSMAVEDAATYLFGPVLAFVLRLRGMTTLHASAVAIGGAAVAFLGPPGAGKSTIAAALARRGCGLLSDDILAVEDRHHFPIQPAHPYVCLWPESVEALYGARDALPPLTPNWDKCCLDVMQHGHRFERQALPLGALYVLNTRADDASAPFIESMSAREGVIALTANSYGALRIDRRMRAREFDLFGRIAARIPLRSVTPSTNSARLAGLCDLLVADATEILQPAGRT